MNKITTSLCLALTAFSLPSFSAGDYMLNSDLSSVSFATIKKQYIVEPASIRTLSGQLSALSETVGGLSLSDSVPVSVTLLFQQ